MQCHGNGCLAYRKGHLVQQWNRQVFRDGLQTFKGKVRGELHAGVGRLAGDHNHQLQGGLKEPTDLRNVRAASLPEGFEDNRVL